MGNTILNFDEFQPIVRLITSMEFNSNSGKALVEIAIPDGLKVDFNMVNKYFGHDFTFRHNENGKINSLKGTLESSELSIWLVNEFSSQKW